MSRSTTNLLCLMAILICSMSFLSCRKSSPSGPDVATPVVLPTGGAAVIQSSQNFAFDILHKVIQVNNDSTTNMMISPLSIYVALSMLNNGAAGTTMDSIEATLRLNNVSSDQLDQICQALLKQLPVADRDVKLSIANSIWYQQNMQPLPSFISNLSTYYQASAKGLDFSNQSSVNTINNWVATNTDQKITRIINQTSPSDLIYLINAVYFNGIWKYPFDKNATADASFNLSNGTSVQAPFMSVKNVKLNYYDNDSVQMIELPYGAGNFSMYAILPAQNISITSVLNNLNATGFQNWQNQSFKEVPFNLQLPKFTYSFSIANLLGELDPMGFTIATGPSANFSNMYDHSGNDGSGIYVSDVLHKTYIAVDEEGTQAAAVTSITVTTTSAGNQPINLSFNRPFAYVIQEKTSGAILFTGIVENPSQQ